MKKEFKTWSEAVAFVHNNRPVYATITETKKKLGIDLTATLNKLKK